MTDEDYDELSTKRDMVRLLANDATAEQLNAVINACIDNRLNDVERHTLLIQTIYRSWYERLGKRQQPPCADFAPTWEDVERMFLDILAVVGAAKPLPPEPPAKPALSDEKSKSQDMAPMARLLVGVPELAPQPTLPEEKSGLQDMAASIARLRVGVPAHGNDSPVLEHIRRALDEPPLPPPSSDQKSGMAVPIRARLSLDWARGRPIR